MHEDVLPDDLRRRLEAGEQIFLLDVREAEELADWPFPGAHHIPLGELGGRTGELPTSGPIVVVCHAGIRSARAADALTNAGWPAASLVGGVAAWDAPPGT